MRRRNFLRAFGSLPLIGGLFAAKAVAGEEQMGVVECDWGEDPLLLIVHAKTGKVFFEVHHLEEAYPDREWFAFGLRVKDGALTWDRILYGFKRGADPLEVEKIKRVYCVGYS